MNLMMYNSSFLDRNYNYALFIIFNGQMIDQYEWKHLWAATSIETNEQHFHYKILSKWISGYALDGQEFFSFRKDCRRCVYYMYCVELYYYSPGKEHFKGSSHDQRYICSQAPLCKPGTTEQEVLEQIKIADDFVKELSSAIIDRLWICDGDADTEHKLLHDDIQSGNVVIRRAKGVLFHRSVQMAACMMLVHPKYACCGRVYNKGVGPFKFCEDHLGDDDLTMEVANEYFDRLYKDIRSTFHSFERTHLEQVMCSEGRLYRKKDIIYEDPVTHKIQIFFTTKCKSKKWLR